MKFTQLGIEGAWLAESQIWTDDRGFFREWFKSEEIREATGIDFSVQQANISKSQRGVIRGIHYSLASEGQSKWITCVQGAVLDVVVDIRPDSPTFKSYEIVELNESNARAMLIGPGLGHGFLALEENSTIAYLLSSPFSPDLEFEIQYNDPDLKIDWGLDKVGGDGVYLSLKDFNAPTISERLSNGKLPMKSNHRLK
jgi:dTDP-4-dehydrorhamnose 3,5-epimerase